MELNENDKAQKEVKARQILLFRFIPTFQQIRTKDMKFKTLFPCVEAVRFLIHAAVQEKTHYDVIDTILP